MKKRGFLFIIISNILFFNIANGQSIEDVIDFANQQYMNGNYHLAAKEYQRARYFGNKNLVASLEDKTANCYFELENFEEAKKHYLWASKLYLDDSLKTEAIFKKASCEIILNNFNLALIDLLGAVKCSSEQEKTKNFLLGSCYFGLENFEKAEKHFIAVLHPDSILQLQSVEEIFAKKKNLYRPNPKTATWLSVFFPGAGQMYAGDIKNSLNSLGLTTGLIFLSIYIYQSYSLADAILSTVPWVQRYYMGGYQHAEKIAIQKRANRRSKSYNKISHILKIQ